MFKQLKNNCAFDSIFFNTLPQTNNCNTCACCSSSSLDNRTHLYLHCRTHPRISSRHKTSAAHSCIISAPSHRSTQPHHFGTKPSEVTTTESEQGHTQINDRMSLTNDSLVSKPYSNSFLQKIYITVTTIHTASPNERPPVLVSHRYNINSLTVPFVYAEYSIEKHDQNHKFPDNSDTRFNPHRKKQQHLRRR